MHRVAILLVSVAATMVFRLVDAAFSTAATIKLSPSFFDMTFDLIAGSAVALIAVDWVLNRQKSLSYHEVTRAGWGFFVGVLVMVILVRYVVPKLDVPDLYKTPYSLLAISNLLGASLLFHSTYLEETKASG